MNMVGMMDRMLQQFSENVQKAENEYMGEDGLLHCSVCNKGTQTEVEFLGVKKKVRCICDCRKAEMDAHKDKELREQAKRRKSVCFSDTNMSNWTFENDDRQNEKLSCAMQNYARNFPDFKKDGKGLLLYGSVGTGKTYYASCVANELIDNGYSVLFRTFKQLERELWCADDKAEYMRSLNRYSLIIFDDLGAERETKYMADIVFDIIDTRYKSGLPFIVTTNLSGEEIKKPQEISYSRIYDRILERCHPIEVSGASRRRQKVKDTYSDMNKKLGL